MNDELARIAEVAAHYAGRCVAVGELSWPHRESTVVELETATGERLIGKAHRQEVKFKAEHIAYQRWVPSLGHSAPELLHADADQQVLIMSKLDAHALAGPNVMSLDAHRQAGKLLARFHGAERPRRLSGYAQGQRQRLSIWVERARPGLLDPGDISFVEKQLAVLDELPEPIGVPCHRDWQPRNWMIDDVGTIYAIDFEHARFAPWYTDLERLASDEWLDTRELAPAFFDGYGRTLSDDEALAFHATAALGHLLTIVWADEHRDDAFDARARRCIAVARQHPSTVGDELNDAPRTGADNA